MRSWKLVLIFILGGASGLIAQNNREVDGPESVINSSLDEGFLVISSDCKTVFFSRATRPMNMTGNNNDGEIWFTELRDNGQWSNPQLMGSPFNTKYQNAVIGVIKEGDIIYQSFNTNPNRDQAESGVYISKPNGIKGSKPEKVVIREFLNRSPRQEPASCRIQCRYGPSLRNGQRQYLQKTDNHFLVPSF